MNNSYFSVSEQEYKLIISYRSADMNFKKAIDKLLGISERGNKMINFIPPNTLKGVAK